MVTFFDKQQFHNVLHDTYDLYYNELRWVFSVMPDNYLSEFKGFLCDIALPTRTAYMDTPTHPSMPSVRIIQLVVDVIGDEMRRRSKGEEFDMHHSLGMSQYSENGIPQCEIPVGNYPIDVDVENMKKEVNDDTAEFV